MDFLVQSIKKATVSIEKGISHLMPEEAKKPPYTCLLEIPSRTPGRYISVQLYRDKLGHRPMPVLLHFHGTSADLDFPNTVAHDPRKSASASVFDSAFISDATRSCESSHYLDNLFCRHVANFTLFNVHEVPCHIAREKPGLVIAHDVQAVLLDVLALPQEYDQSRIFLSGCGAGVQQALLAAWQSERWFGKQVVQAVIALDPPTNLRPYPDPAVLLPGIEREKAPGFMANTFSWSYVPRRDDDRDVDSDDELRLPAWMPRKIPQQMRTPRRLLAITCVNDQLVSTIEGLAANSSVRRHSDRLFVLDRVPDDEEFDKDILADCSGSEELATEEAFSIACELLWAVR